jgi:hypothetical protein
VAQAAADIERILAADFSESRGEVSFNKQCREGGNYTPLSLSMDIHSFAGRDLNYIVESTTYARNRHVSFAFHGYPCSGSPAFTPPLCRAVKDGSNH